MFRFPFLLLVFPSLFSLSPFLLFSSLPFDSTCSYLFLMSLFWGDIKTPFLGSPWPSVSFPLFFCPLLLFVFLFSMSSTYFVFIFLFLCSCFVPLPLFVFRLHSLGILGSWHVFFKGFCPFLHFFDPDFIEYVPLFVFPQLGSLRITYGLPPCSPCLWQYQLGEGLWISSLWISYVCLSHGLPPFSFCLWQYQQGEGWWSSFALSFSLFLMHGSPPCSSCLWQYQQGEGSGSFPIRVSSHLFHDFYLWVYKLGKDSWSFSTFIGLLFREISLFLGTFYSDCWVSFFVPYFLTFLACSLGSPRPEGTYFYSFFDFCLVSSCLGFLSFSFDLFFILCFGYFFSWLFFSLFFFLFPLFSCFVFFSFAPVLFLALVVGGPFLQWASVGDLG